MSKKTHVSNDIKNKLIYISGAVVLVLVLVFGWSIFRETFSKVANVSLKQYSSFVYTDNDVNLLLKHGEQKGFWLYTLDVAQHHDNKKTVLLQTPHKNTAVETVFQTTLNGTNDQNAIHLININHIIKDENLDVYQKMDKLTESGVLPKELQNNGAQNFLTDNYGVSITIRHEPTTNRVYIQNNGDDFHNILFYPFVQSRNDKEMEISSEGLCDSFCLTNIKEQTTGTDVSQDKGIDIAKDKPSYFFVTSTKDLVEEDGGNVPNELNLGNRFLKVVITPIGNNKQYQLSIIEYKIIDSPKDDGAYQVDVFIPHEVRPVEQFLVPKEQTSVVFSKDAPEEKQLFDELVEKEVIFAKDGQVNQISVLPKGQAECEQGATCIGDIKPKDNDYQESMEKLYQKAVGRSILTEIDRANQHFYVTGVVLEEAPSVVQMRTSAGDSVGGKVQEADISLNNQHLNISINGVEYAPRPLKGYLSEYIDGSRQTIYSLSQTAIDDLNKSENVMDKTIKFGIEIPPKKGQSVIFLTKLNKDNAHQYQGIRLMAGGHECDVIYTDDINKKEDENDTKEADASQAVQSEHNHVFIQPLVDRRFGFVYISHDNIAKCQNQAVAMAPFEIELPIGVCSVGQCDLFRNDAKLSIHSRNNELMWQVTSRNFYQPKRKQTPTYAVKNVLLADGTPLVKDGRTLTQNQHPASMVRELGLLSFVGENELFAHHLLGLKSQDKSFETITLSIQKEVQEQLQKAVNTSLAEEKQGAVFVNEHKDGQGNAQVIATVMNAKTGEILAATDSRQEMLKNINLTGVEVWDNGYPHTTKYLRWLPAYQNRGSHETTGSTAKLFTALSILDYAISRQDEDMYHLIAGGSQTFNNFGYPVDFNAGTYPSHFGIQDWRSVSSGKTPAQISLAEALKVSNNTYFAWLHEKITPALLYQPPNADDEGQGLLKTAMLPRSLAQYTIANGKTFYKLGYDLPINLLTGTPEELSDTIPAHSWYVSPMTLDVYTGAESYNVLNHRAQVRRVGIGIGRVHLTPIHLASLSASISQGKTIYPRMTQISESLPVHELDGKDLLQVLNKSKINGKPSLEYIIDGMRLAVESASGTAKALNKPQVCVYAKTGTAPIQSNRVRVNNASITGFAYQSKDGTPCSDKTDVINQSDVISFACTIRYSRSSGGASCGQLMRNFLNDHFGQAQ